MRLTGAQIILDTLFKLKLNRLFAYDDPSLKWLFSERNQTDHLDIVFAKKPENTMMMAMGYTRTTGLASTVIVPSGSGTTQIVSGLVTAYLDSLPILCITGQVPSSVLGTDAFQETDTIGMTQTCSKHNFLVKNCSELERILVEAHHLCTTGRPGPVVIALPIDLLEQLSETSNTLPTVRLKGYRPVSKGHSGQIKKALDLILQSEKPLIYCGGGAMPTDDKSSLQDFAELFNIPLASTLTGTSAFLGSHPLNLGLIGRGGKTASNMTANSADLVIALGTRFNPHVIGKFEGFRLLSHLIHVDVDPASIARTNRADVPIVGQTNEVLQQILDLASEKKSEIKRFRESLSSWHEQIQTWRNQHQLSSQTRDHKIFDAKNCIKIVSQITENRALLTCGHENLSLILAKQYTFNTPRFFCATGGMELLGFAINSAIGAQLAHAEVPVIAITTIKHLMMNPCELMTIHELKLPLRIVLLKSEIDQENTKNLDVEMFVKSFGLTYIACDQLKTFETQFKRGLNLKKAVVLDCVF